MNSRPFAEYAIGGALGALFRRVDHSVAPLAASNARNVRSRYPANTRPPEVISVPAVSGARCRSIHTVLPVSMLIAWSRPYLPSLAGRGRTVHRTPVDRLPRSPAGTGTRSMHASVIGM